MIAVVLAVAGALLGFGADRLSVRWPAHEEGVTRRAIDWRTAVVTCAGGLAFLGLGLRWGGPGSEPRDLVLVGIFFAALIVLLATDLDQRLLPDVITLPLISFAAATVLLGWDPLLAGKELALVSALLAAVVAPLFLAVTSLVFRGGIGMGDLKLSISLGLFLGASRLFAGFVLGSLLFSMAVIALVVSRRIGMRSVIPFGPALIIGAIIGSLLA